MFLRFAEIYFGLLLGFVPYIALCFIPFWEQIKTASRKKITVVSIVILGYITVMAIVRVFTGDWLSPVITLTTKTLCLTLYYYALKVPFLKLLYINSITIAYNVCLSCMVKYIEASFFPARYHIHYNITFSLISLTILVLSFPLVWMFIKKHIKPTLTGDIIAWKYLLVNPATLVLVLTYMIGSESIEVVSDIQYLINTLLLTFAVFMLLYFMSRLIIQTEKNARAQSEKESLERIDRMKTEMIAEISHETRTPLAVLSGYTGLISMELRAQGVNEQMAKDLDRVSDETRRIANMMEQMQKLSLKKETECNKIQLDMGEIVCQIGRLYEPILERSNVRLVMDIPDNLPAVYGIPDELTQVVFNLLQNAKNHIEQGAIKIEIKTENNNLKVIITDTGSGISPELIPHVFEHGVNGSENGYGLGLAICKEIIESHDGVVNIESELGKGTTASFALPIYNEG